uniref:Putative Erf family protein n=1 Tax=viral metagenome TaxID=1070528 RepID=A0A6M3KI39_9ZZZZ
MTGYSSEVINELAAALSQAQAEMSGAKKDTDNPHLRSKYADLASCIEAGREPLAKHGLAVTQLIHHGEPMTLVTLLLHSSGQWLKAVAPLVAEEQKGINASQALGSVISYMRRYSFQAIIGQASEDDDAHGAGSAEPREQSEPQGKLVCPSCGKQAVIKGKPEYGGGYVCWKKEGGCGKKFSEAELATTPPTKPAKMTEDERKAFAGALANLAFDREPGAYEDAVKACGYTMEKLDGMTDSETARIAYRAIKLALETEPDGPDAGDEQLDFDMQQ